jgi:hypothetical protein
VDPSEDDAASGLEGAPPPARLHSIIDEPGPNPELVLIWQTLAARRVSYDTMMWQTPALGMTAQAFLLTLALGGQTTTTGRMVAAVLAAALAAMTMQLLAKHRYHVICYGDHDDGRRKECHEAGRWSFLSESRLLVELTPRTKIPVFSLIHIHRGIARQ